MSLTNEHLLRIATINYKKWTGKNLGSRVKKAMKKIDRQEFLPSISKKYAYTDFPVSIGYGGTCSQPSLVAYMADLLSFKKGMNVLEIGSGCGYSAAFSSYLIGKKGRLTAVEIIPELAELARKNLKYHFKDFNDRIEVVCVDGSLGYMPNAPYDRIYFTVGVNKKTFSSDIIIDQLKEKGIFVFPEENGNIYFLKKEKESVREHIIQEPRVSFLSLKGENK
jgi:protein-L-isoaspartate(D-aspartate) O-methyltransferase